MRNIKNRKFGVELEFGIPFPVLSDRGWNTYAPYGLMEKCLNENKLRNWKVTTDCSLYIPGCFEIEVNTPILRGDKGISDLRKGVKFLKKNFQGKVNRTCGLHVHVSVEDMTSLEKANIFYRYQKFQGKINKTMAESRTTRLAYNRPYRKSKKECLNREIEIHIQNNWHEGLPYALESAVLAFRPEYGTVEFRQHAGTLKASQVSAWARWCINFVEQSGRLLKKNLKEVRDTKSFDVIKDASPLAGVRHTSVRNHFGKMVA